jgi:hypothetical protein
MGTADRQSGTEHEDVKLDPEIVSLAAIAKLARMHLVLLQKLAERHFFVEHLQLLSDSLMEGAWKDRIPLGQAVDIDA